MIGSFAMNGNHEAYARNSVLLNWLQSDLQQPATCFFLYNARCCILGLDTGYNSEGIPFLGWLGEKYNVPLIKPRCDLPGEVIDWLKQTVIPLISANPSLILLTHHQYISSFEQEYDNAAKQLVEYRDIQDTLMVTEQWQAQSSNPKLLSQTIDPSLKQ